MSIRVRSRHCCQCLLGGCLTTSKSVTLIFVAIRLQGDFLNVLFGIVWVEAKVFGTGVLGGAQLQ